MRRKGTNPDPPAGPRPTPPPSPPLIDRLRRNWDCNQCAWCKEAADALEQAQELQRVASNTISQQDALLNMHSERIEELERNTGVHVCHSDCTRVECVQTRQVLSLERRIEQLEAALREAIGAVQIFHGPDAWEIYRDNSPEMKRWNQLLVGDTAPCLLDCSDAVMDVSGCDHCWSLPDSNGIQECAWCPATQTVEISSDGK